MVPISHGKVNLNHLDGVVALWLGLTMSDLSIPEIEAHIPRHDLYQFYIMRVA
jgi:hypothetical protein